MYTGSFPETSIYNTWIENVEITSDDDGSLVDLSGLVEIKLLVIDPRSKYIEMTLLMSAGQITIPALGIIQWIVAPEVMGGLNTQLYEIVLLLIDPSTTVTMVLGNLSVLS